MTVYLWVGENLVCKVWCFAQDVEPDQEAGSEGISQLQEGHLVLPHPLAVQADDGPSKGAPVRLRVVIRDQVDLGLTAVHYAPVFENYQERIYIAGLFCAAFPHYAGCSCDI